MASLVLETESNVLEESTYSSPSEEEDEDGDISHQSMWLGRPLPPLWKGQIEDPLLPSLIEKYDDITITEKRIQYKLDVALRETEWSNDLQKQIPRSTDAHEIGLKIIETIREVTATNDKDNEIKVNKCKKDLSLVMDELRLDYPVKLGGPLSLPYPSSMNEDIVFYAQMNWEYFRASSVKWTDSATLQWVRFALMNSHNDKDTKHAALCLLGRIEAGPSQGNKPSYWQMHEYRNDNGASGSLVSRHPTLVFEDIQEPAKFCSISLMDTLNNYTKQNNLRSIESLGGIVAPDDHQLTSNELDLCGGEKLSQVAFLPFLRLQHQEIVESARCGYGKFMFYEMGCRGMLLILSHFLQERHFNEQTKMIGKEGGAEEKGPIHKLAPCKTLARIYAKADSDHINAPKPVTAQNLDVCRKSICSSDASCQLKTYEELKSKFRILRVKNTFTSNPEETLGMMQILVNILLEPKNADNTPMTFGDMLDLENGNCFAEAVESACNANPGSSYSSCIRQSAALFSKIPNLREEPIKMVVEVQLHLSWFLEKRKLTHLWFKVLRALTLPHLTMDCQKFRDGPTKVIEGLTKEDEGWQYEDGYSSTDNEGEDDDYHLHSYAVCDGCECHLFLSSQIQNCVGGHGLVNTVVTCDSNNESTLFCSFCDQLVYSGNEVQSCRLCDFDVCKKCYEAEWWHESSGSRDYCKKDFIELTTEEEKAKFIKMKSKESMGVDDMNEYFGEEEQEEDPEGHEVISRS
jgi:hypothetical protein